MSWKGAPKHATARQRVPKGSSMRQVREPCRCHLSTHVESISSLGYEVALPEPSIATACQTAEALATRAATCTRCAPGMHHRKYSGTALLTSVMPAPLGGAWSNCTYVEQSQPARASGTPTVHTAWPRVMSQGSQHSSIVHAPRQSTSTPPV